MNYQRLVKALKLILILAAVFLPPLSWGKQTLNFSYWTDATEPFAFNDEQGQLTNGIIKKIGDELAQRTNFEARYLKVPVKRLEGQLTAGNIHIDCITNPIWKEFPDNYHWSPVLFKGADRFLVRKGEQYTIDSFSQLKGKTVGIYNGYTYHPDIMKMFENGDAVAEQVAGIEVGVRLVNLGRLDTLIDFGTLLQYQIKKGNYHELTLANQHADNYDLQCAYSPKLPIEPKLLDKHLSDMISEGFITKTLKLYH